MNIKTVLIKVVVKAFNPSKFAILKSGGVHDFVNILFNYEVIYFNDDYWQESIENDIQDDLEFGVFEFFGLINNNTPIVDFIVQNDIRPYDEYYFVCKWKYIPSDNYFGDSEIDMEYEVLNKIHTKRMCNDDQWQGIINHTLERYK